MSMQKKDLNSGRLIVLLLWDKFGSYSFPVWTSMDHLLSIYQLKKQCIQWDTRLRFVSIIRRNRVVMDFSGNTEWCQITYTYKSVPYAAKPQEGDGPYNYRLCEVPRLGHEKTSVDQMQNSFYRPSMHKYWIRKLTFSSGYNDCRNIAKRKKRYSVRPFRYKRKRWIWCNLPFWKRQKTYLVYV